ncbi:hypothetical protein DBR00_16185 [Pseudomonas sp. HMWF032]|uniref:DUF4304 domain-containing protein n=1 Tax=Pseudomonas sp. HMWF032 TaxID=2056866 RepID=UPI000D38D71D|nr:DUF4304 domain-containing protein [Pseudomonas sp. HMWF032]PTS82663.1 hypothetical protein DBR00_16185 [Pseudomonas sp. HMWF032]PTT83493.1 hypothetical protein DBR41_10555 [Pseudomonas sp. HMWF010]
MSARASAFDNALREIAVPALASHGFKFDGSRTFRRFSEGRRTCLIINFQLGQRSMAGKFTINLGVFVEGDNPGISTSRANAYDCRFERRTRIGALIPLQFPKLASLPWIGFLFGGPDKWWVFSDDSSDTDAVLSDAVDKITAHGLSWLNTIGL